MAESREVLIAAFTPALKWNSNARQFQQSTHLPPGVYRVVQHYFKDNGTEVAEVVHPRYDRSLLIWVHPSDVDVRTWEIIDA